jgi:hypothetical protein
MTQLSSDELRAMTLSFLKDRVSMQTPLSSGNCTKLKTKYSLLWDKYNSLFLLCLSNPESVSKTDAEGRLVLVKEMEKIFENMGHVQKGLRTAEDVSEEFGNSLAEKYLYPKVGRPSEKEFEDAREKIQNLKLSREQKNGK